MGIKSFFKSIGSHIHNFAHSVTSHIHNGFNSVKSGVSSFAHSVGTTIKSAANTGKQAVTSVYQNYTKFYSKLEDDVAGKGGIIDHAVDKTTGVLSTPLIIVGVALGGFLLLGKL
jgi:phage-related protein